MTFNAANTKPSLKRGATTCRLIGEPTYTFGSSIESRGVNRSGQSQTCDGGRTQLAIVRILGAQQRACTRFCGVERRVDDEPCREDSTRVVDQVP